MLRHLDEQITALGAEVVRRTREEKIALRLMTITGVGRLIVTAVVTLAPPAMFRKKYKLRCLVSLKPKQYSTGDNERLGATTEMG